MARKAPIQQSAWAAIAVAFFPRGRMTALVGRHGQLPPGPPRTVPRAETIAPTQALHLVLPNFSKITIKSGPKTPFKASGRRV